MALTFRQLFDAESSTFTYILADGKTREAVLIDPVLEQVDRDLLLLDELGLTLVYALNTHCHADHITGTGKIKKLRPATKSVISKAGGAKADVLLEDGDTVPFGGFALQARSTPGHTDGCLTYYLPEPGMAFTGDALLIRGCGRTDFQGGDAGTLYDSVHARIFSLPDETLLYPAHDYKGRTVTSVAEEKRHNLRLTKSRADFIDLMGKLGLPYPKKMDVAGPANMNCGLDS